MTTTLIILSLLAVFAAVFMSVLVLFAIEELTGTGD